jgi:hypothetical protein
LRFLIVVITHDIPELSSLPVYHIMPDIVNPQDIDPLHNNRLGVVYKKLELLANAKANINPNKGLCMNSPHLVNLDFTPTDRLTMQKHIEIYHPNMQFRFVTTDKGFTYSSSITKEILGLFKPT